MPLKRHHWVLVVSILVAILLVAGCGRKQHVSFSYGFAISPKKGEVLKNVTVYLPFPTKDGKPMMEVYRGLMKDYTQFRVKEFPSSKISLIETKYGPMLKVYVPEIDERGYGLDGGFGFKEPFSKEPFAPRFPINPRLNPRTLTGFRSGSLCDSYIYTEFENAEELGLALSYEIHVLSPALLPLDYVPEDRYEAYVGWDYPPLESGSRVKYFKNEGWLEVPLADLGYYKDDNGEG